MKSMNESMKYLTVLFVYTYASIYKITDIDNRYYYYFLLLTKSLLN